MFFHESQSTTFYDIEDSSGLILITVTLFFLDYKYDKFDFLYLEYKLKVCYNMELNMLLNLIVLLKTMIHQNILRAPNIYVCILTTYYPGYIFNRRWLK